ncbi:periplasmic nitrate reductase, NapE protein [Rhizobiales bacterium RZME27]|jgi:nitrate reductase NapE|uniref:Periplasmic nitrate reductase, NapE protein n=1 Tax=Endobacterium cereale TaxID=2663029 RepID=A0A6A8A6M0_9HYPH|nr:periplasmic nitrate reductase, NapE protein [Endobacterium cereale]MEB2848556.1 periplasmic nitrate reductase, NapE protein [Endobacterium cereale]MQY44491.1 periplasmic nitrate reductase, NapE protein [Endobacterium cereale]
MTEAKTTTERISFRRKRRRELLTFAVLAFGIWPVVAVGTVASYGFMVWAYQIVYGPPGPHDITPARPNSAE